MEQMTMREFRIVVRNAAPNVEIVELGGYAHLSKPVTMEVSDGRDCWEKQAVLGWSPKDHVITTEYFYLRCRPITKKPRLMTPAECAGKWTSKDGERVLVCGYRGNHITTAHAVTSTVKELHERGWMIADTPTSEPRSMEIES